MVDFPRGALTPREAVPRITPEHAAEVIRLIKEDGSFPDSPAIIVAVWTGGLVKYLVDDQQVEKTIANFLAAVKAKEGGE